MNPLLTGLKEGEMKKFPPHKVTILIVASIFIAAAGDLRAAGLPVVNAGPDVTVTIATNGIPLNGSVTNIGNADGQMAVIQWRLVNFIPPPGTPGGTSGGTATFANSASPVTTVFLSRNGQYTLRLTASNSFGTSFDEMVITFENILQVNLPPSLKDAIRPEPANLTTYVVNKPATIRTGKALFWDMQVGSDGRQACASCHFHAGADHRIKNQISPGFLGAPLIPTATTFEIGSPNYTLKASDFPTHKLLDPEDRFSTVLSDADDVISSQGIFRFIFQDIFNPADQSVDLGIHQQDPDGFSVAGTNVRRVEPRNTPTTINAVFNLRNFWDGRASHFFNGVNPFGDFDPTARVLINPDPANPATIPVSQTVHLDFSSLASQAIGPPGSPFEMSFDGRTFAKIGKKLLSLPPLAKQLVHPNDSELGIMSNSPANGINTTYAAMIQASFDPRFWNSSHKFMWNGSSWVDLGVGIPANTDEYTLMEVNFGLFFGLSIQLYEATLIADDTPFDRFLGSTTLGIPPIPNALTTQQKLGKDIFFGKGLCFNCHGGPELTLAGVNALGLVAAPGTVPEAPIEMMQAAQGQQMATLVFADFPFPNAFPLTFDPRGKAIHISDQVGRIVFSGIFPGQPISNCTAGNNLAILLNPGTPPLGGLAQANFFELPNCNRLFTISIDQAPTNPPTFAPIGTYAVGILNGTTQVADASINVIEPILYDLGFYNIGVRPTAEDAALAGFGPFGDPLSFALLAQNGGNIGFPIPPFVDLTKLTAVQGSFKVPGLRNVELTGPYFHNGGQATLEQVVDFYNRGGDFHETNIATLDPDITELFLTPSEKAALVAFLTSLTDDRVRWEKAPFDHPQLFVSNGQTGDDLSAVPDFTNPNDPAGTTASDDILHIPAIGAGGRAAEGLGPLQPFHTLLAAASPATTSLSLNGTAYTPGNRLILSASVTTTSSAMVLDWYVKVTLPAGRNLYLRSGGGFSFVPTPFIANWTTATFNGQLFSYSFIGTEPAGSYTIHSFFTQPGTMIRSGQLPAAQTGFAFSRGRGSDG